MRTFAIALAVAAIAALSVFAHATVAPTQASPVSTNAVLELVVVVRARAKGGITPAVTRAQRPPLVVG
jgi:hypothetical protein